MRQEPSIHVTWPARQFHWARLDASTLPAQGMLGLRRRPSSMQLSYLFENVLPLPVDELQVAFAPIRDDTSALGRTYLACGIERSRLSVDLPPGAVSLAPCELHEVEALRDVGAIDPELPGAVALNLLCGDFEPKAIRRLRKRAMIELVAAMLLVAALMTCGLYRRAQIIQQGTLSWRQAESEIIQKLLGPESGNPGQPQQVQLTVELRRLRQTRRTDLPASDLATSSGHVIDALTELLHLWPETNALTQSLSISPGRIAIRAALPDAEQVQAFVAALEPLPDWQLQQPAIRANRDGLDLDLTFMPAPQASSIQLRTSSEVRP